jgi:hypothetical protein
LRRRLVRRSLTEWCKFAGFEPAAHHLLLIDALEQVARGEVPRLAVFMPPGSAKSTYSSVLFPPWLMQSVLGSVLAASHTTELAEKWGRRVRNLINEHSAALGIQTAADNQAAGRWALTSGSEYYAAGVGSGIAGFRARFGIIDDPIRSRQDADSELIRDRIWDWYINDFRTRLVPGAAEILIQTRWHEDDLAGRALQHNDWKVISLPAIAEDDDLLGRKPGEPLWDDDAYGYGHQIEELRKNTPPRTWSRCISSGQPRGGRLLQVGLAQTLRQTACSGDSASLWRKRLCCNGERRRFHRPCRCWRGSRRQDVSAGPLAQASRL